MHKDYFNPNASPVSMTLHGATEVYPPVVKEKMNDFSNAVKEKYKKLTN
ncbi:hypothetical protein HOH45_02210 [bacterium]|jgi:hypothetical protein|nr:hypothetical protein [bacterium]